MIENPNKILLDKILTRIPAHMKPAGYLMGKLGLSKDSVYRRLRQEISFTYEEAVILAKDLHFSLDNNNDRSNCLSLSIDKVHTISDATQSLVKEFEHLNRRMSELSISHDPEMFVTKNRVNILPVEYHENLFRFFYYKWLHLLGVIPMYHPFSQTTVPQELVNCAKNQELLHSIDNVTVIIDTNEFQNTIKEILYFYKQGLITKDEIEVLKVELIEKISYEARRLSAKSPLERKHLKCYLSDVNLSTNTMYTRDGDSVESTFWIYSIIPHHTNSSQICAHHIEWLENFKRYSTLITGSGGIVLSRFISEQEEYVKNIDKILY